MHSNNSSVTPSQVERILYKQITGGDLLKFQAKSNISKSGGGARDLRFGKFELMEEMVRILFPHAVQKVRSRNKSKGPLEVYRGRFYWMHDGLEQSCEVDFEPPTDSRNTEGRIATVHKIPCFTQAEIPTLNGDNVVILVFAQMSDGRVWPFFTDNVSLAQDGWDTRVAEHILKCIAAKRRAGNVVIGYKDFNNNLNHCNGEYLL